MKPTSLTELIALATRTNQEVTPLVIAFELLRETYKAPSDRVLAYLTVKHEQRYANSYRMWHHETYGGLK